MLLPSCFLRGIAEAPSAMLVIAYAEIYMIVLSHSVITQYQCLILVVFAGDRRAQSISLQFHPFLLFDLTRWPLKVGPLLLEIHCRNVRYGLGDGRVRHTALIQIVACDNRNR